MRNAVNLITALSCMVISAGFFSRHNLFVGGVVAGVGVLYVWKAVAQGRRRGIGAGRDAPKPIPNDAETAALRAELEGSLVEYRSRMKLTRGLFILLSGAVAFVLVVFGNIALGLGICPFAAGAGWLFWRNAKAVQLLEENL